MNIIIYFDNDYDYDNNNIINTIKKTYEIIIFRLLINKEEKCYTDNNIITEIYSDQYTEDILIKNCICVIYLSKIKRSQILLQLLEKYNKYVIFNEESIIDKISLLMNKEINLEKLDYFDQLNNFKNYLLSLPDNDDHHENQNIKLIHNKIIKNNEKEKINIITFFKNTDIKILNIIQKKCIIENLKNSNVNQIIILGQNLQAELKEITDSNLILYESDKNISFKDLIEVSNTVFENKIICLLRSDIILPNQTSLDDLEFDMLSSNNEIISISRIDRLINGNLIKSEKLNRILFSTEQDAWIFKSPINLDINNLNMLENIYFYDKYSELYFNKVLKMSGYNIINNTLKYKIIRIMNENNVESRLLINNDSKITENIFLLPDNESLDKISIEQLIKCFNINDKEVYKIKCELFNKYYKDKIINQIMN